MISNNYHDFEMIIASHKIVPLSYTLYGKEISKHYYTVTLIKQSLQGYMANLEV